MATPATTVPRIVGDCVDAGVKSAVVISAGFRERGPEGAELERQIQQQLRRGAMRLIGPNCLGIMNPTVGLNATFAKEAPRPGNVAFLSQSGALLTAILDWAQVEQVGFSAIVSTGSMLDVGWGDLIYYFGDDPHTDQHSLTLTGDYTHHRRPPANFSPLGVNECNGDFSTIPASDPYNLHRGTIGARNSGS